MLGYDDVSDVVTENSRDTVKPESERCIHAALTDRVRGSSRYRGMVRGITQTIQRSLRLLLTPTSIRN